MCPVPVMLQMGGIDEGRCMATALQPLQWSASCALHTCILLLQCAQPAWPLLHALSCSNVWTQALIAPSQLWSSECVSDFPSCTDRGRCTMNLYLPVHVTLTYTHPGKANHPPFPRSLSCACSRDIHKQPYPTCPIIGWLHEQCHHSPHHALSHILP